MVGPHDDDVATYFFHLYRGFVVRSLSEVWR